MLEALVFFTFIAGVFTGIGILAMIFVYIVNRDENKKVEQSAVARARASMQKVGENPFTTPGPILKD